MPPCHRGDRFPRLAARLDDSEASVPSSSVAEADTRHDPRAQEAEAIRLCNQILDGFKRISISVDIFLTKRNATTSRLPLSPHT